MFGSEYDAEKYEAVVEACALAADLKILPAGDQTEIGENGVTCSIFLDIATGEISSDLDRTKKMMENLNIIQISHLTFDCS